MKKLLLTLGATALILGLGACNNSKKAKSEDKSVPEAISKTASSDDVVSEAGGSGGGGEEGKIYCKMEYDWWTTDGAAIALYCWGAGGAKATWPGERMTPVEGQDHMWSIDYDGTTYPNLIFVRVNGTGDIADWGAKTKDLTAPTDGSNLYTITNSTESWGDPGCDGVWSTY